MDSDSALERAINVLLAEDSKLQAEVVKRTLAEFPGLNLVEIASDGVETLAYLRREGKYQDAVRPELVLLDINMPNKDGFEVLKEMKADPQLRRIPVVMLTSSTEDRNIVKAYEDGACTFIAKPLSREDFKQVFSFFAHYWTHLAKLPPEDP
jgi:CheY-like chemotaxis protein